MPEVGREDQREFGLHSSFCNTLGFSTKSGLSFTSSWEHFQGDKMDDIDEEALREVAIGVQTDSTKAQYYPWALRFAKFMNLDTSQLEGSKPEMYVRNV